MNMWLLPQIGTNLSWLKYVKLVKVNKTKVNYLQKSIKSIRNKIHTTEDTTYRLYLYEVSNCYEIKHMNLGLVFTNRLLSNLTVV